MLFEDYGLEYPNAPERGLNPYSTGICSLSAQVEREFDKLDDGLNPYSTGICSLRVQSERGTIHVQSLNPYSTGICSLSSSRSCLCNLVAEKS